MNKLISVTTAIAATALALLSGAAPASAQTAPDTLLSTNMRVVAEEFGDQDGHIVTTDAAGGVQFLAYGPRELVIYTAGDILSSSDIFAFCSYSAAAGLSSCVPLDLSGGGGPSEYVCESFPPYNDGWCQCSGGEDCADLADSGECTEDLYCPGDGDCYCANW